MAGPMITLPVRMQAAHVDILFEDSELRSALDDGPICAPSHTASVPSCLAFVPAILQDSSLWCGLAGYEEAVIPGNAG